MGCVGFRFRWEWVKMLGIDLDGRGCGVLVKDLDGSA